MKLLDPVPHLSKAKCPPLTKQIKKLGTIRTNVVEATPVVWKGQLLRFEWARNHNDNLDVGCYRFVDMDSDETISEFAPNHGFGCCYCENDVMYVHGMRGPEPDDKEGFWAHGPGGAHTLDVLWSDDLQNWHQKTALTFPDSIKVFNTSVCKGRDGYIMAIEIGGDDPIVGNAFTCVFARSDNLLDWELLPTDTYIYDQARYTACPVIRYVDGYYYLICLESLPAYRWAPYIVRTPDLEHYEWGVRNPVMMFEECDKRFLHPERFTEAERERVYNAVNSNNSDIDLCDYNGKTVIVYSWGNQLSGDFLALAEYDGSSEEFLKSFF